MSAEMPDEGAPLSHRVARLAAPVEQRWTAAEFCLTTHEIVDWRAAQQPPAARRRLGAIER